MCHSYNSGATPRRRAGSLSMMSGGGSSSTISSHLNGEKRDGPRLQHARLALSFVSWSLASDKLDGPMEFSRLWKKRKKVKLLISVRLFSTPGTVAYQAPPSMGFSRQEYWSGLPFPSPGDLPNAGIEPRSPTLQADSLPSEPPGKPF